MSDPASEYRIRTVGDFMAVPEDCRDVCLREFAVWLSIGETAKKLLTGIPAKWPTTFVWIDDGLHTATVSVEAGKEKILVAHGKMKEFA